MKNKPVILVILDGFGIAPPAPGNAVILAKKPNIDKYISSYPAMTLVASGESVGLSWGEMGTSEIGHQNIGSGTIVYQWLPRINKAISDGTFFDNEAFLKAIEHTKKNRSKLHIFGLVSSGGVHSHIDHLFALLELAKKEKVKEVFIHVFLDGRDTIYNTGKGFIQELLDKIKKIKINAKICDISGRFYAMDRDNHWERIEKAFNAMTRGESDEKFENPVKAIESSYKNQIYDEEFVPIVITEKNKPVGLVEDKDAIIFFNFRADRARQITESFILPGFNKFPRPSDFSKIFFAGMTQYDKDLPLDAFAFKPLEIKNPLAKVISDAKLKQLHIAETEKYAHVTYFFNAGIEEPFSGEERIVIPSPRVSSFAEKPEMSALKVTDEILKAVTENRYDFIVVNYANPDIVAHTGNLKATINAIETVDKCLGKIVNLALSKNGIVFITADHGNAEELLNIKTGEMDKEHSTNPVPFIIIGHQWEGKSMGLPDSVGGDLSLVTPSGVLADIAPTILKVMGLKQPSDMTGTALI
ncbi:2,3-bisphosphoglycerate-independent phosphoglycerate mutase [Candidatus Falkowbacteria bacterium]|nr:2,3-bisphosphoglycerate-independent phosphoglycerate mutase [Candidatus Falkowbacteria bacterium]